MQSKILSQKPLFNKNGENIVDLTAGTIKYSGDSVIINVILVDEHMQMRPDLAAYAAYGMSDNWDLIMKFNGISNPFSLEVGQYLLIPDINYMNSQLITDTKSKSSPSEKVRNQYLDENKKSKIDPNKIIYDKMISNSINNVSKFNLPPNIAEPGKKEVSFQDGIIYLGGKD